MTCVRRNLRIMLFLVACLALWNLSSTAVIGPVRLPKQDAEEWWKDLKTIPPFDWKKFTMPDETIPSNDWKKFTMPDFDGRPTPAPMNFDGFTFDRSLFTRLWERFSLTPFDWDWDRDRTTVKPFDWDRPTFKPFDWNRRTVKPFEWNRHTIKPFDWNRRKDDDRDHYRPPNDTTLKLAIFLPLTVGIFIVFICKYFVCNGEDNSDGSAPTLHPPPRRVVPPPTRREFTNPQSSVWTTTRVTLRQELLSPAANSTIPAGSTASTQGSGPLDKPPDYSAVVLGDFIKEGQTKFPSVLTTIPDTPPPQYDDKSMKY